MHWFKYLLVYLPVPAALLVDQLSKRWAEGLFGGFQALIPGLLDARYIRNHGGLFGLLDPVTNTSDRLLLNVLTGLALVILVVAAARTQQTKTVRHLGFACMIGGASSNLLDRLLHGYVIDFLALGRLPVVNPADLFLAVGILLVCGDILFLSKESG